MKRNNFFISLLICLGLMFAVSSCNDKEEPRELRCWAVIVCEYLFNNLPDATEFPLNISDVRIEGNGLIMTVSVDSPAPLTSKQRKSRYSQATNFVEIVTDGKFMASLPVAPPQALPARALRLYLQPNFPLDNEDIINALKQGVELFYLIECLQVEGTNSVLLHISGTEYNLLYEW